MRAPHPIPYQGSKRLLAEAILAHAPERIGTLYEPFAGSAALTLAAASRGRARAFAISDAFAPLASLWRAIVEHPAALADDYAALWRAQDEDGDHYERVRDDFNARHAPASLLYLLARCVKAAVRFNARGEFNQSPDRRRRGVRPERMRSEIEHASALLRGRTAIGAMDFEDAIAAARPGDLVYLDPPWQGTTLGRDKRYRDGLEPARLVAAVERLVTRGVPVLLSYDGRTGERRYGADLPVSLGLRRVDLRAGRSAQATLLGRDEETIESLYVSR